MENPELETFAAEDSSHLCRNRSFKSKQLVRSQAIRETASPPRTSPLPPTCDVTPPTCDVTSPPCDVTPPTCDDSPPECDVIDVAVADGDGDGVCEVKNLVEIQITGGAWDSPADQLISRRWAECAERRVCVCGECAPCQHCRSARRKQASKQDSGISDECPDCSDTELSGGGNDTLRKSKSLDLESTEAPAVCRCSERRDNPKNIQVCRADSDERTDLAGLQLVNFIKATLNKNAKDRAMMLRIERDLHALVNDDRRCVVRFPVMSSYQRMLVHRCAALFHLSHHLDPNKCVLVSKTVNSSGRIPCTNFNQWCTDSLQGSPTHTQHKSILKRAAHSLESCGAAGGAGGAGGRSKSLEQRERDYLRVRRRIFSSDNCSQEEGQWPQCYSGPVKLLTPDSGNRSKLLKVHSLEAAPGGSTNCRPAVSKSHSFGGCGVRMLSRQGDLASSSWRLSPSSSGYKTLSLRSTDSITHTPSPTGGVSPEPGASPQSQSGALLWAFTEVSCVPRGALIIHPQTGQPLSNPDGSVYRYDPANPPIVYGQTHDETQSDPSGELRRGRLEKQNSFLDNDCECRPSETSKGYCLNCQSRDVSKDIVETNQQSEIPTAETNQVTAYEPSTNQRACEQLTNQGAESYAQSYVYRELEPPTSRGQQSTASYIQTDTQTQKGHLLPDQTHLRQLPVPTVVYQQTIAPPTYQYTNQLQRMDSQLGHPVYQQVATPGDEVKHDEPTFRIDASYPYQPLEPYVSYNTPHAVDHNAVQHRSYGVAYGQQLEQPVLPSYPISNCILSQHYPAQYQQMQWAMPPLLPPLPPLPLSKPPSPPTLYLPPEPYSQMYNQNQMYPMVQYPYYPSYVSHVMPQYLPSVQAAYPAPDNSVKCERRPHAATPEEKPCSNAARKFVQRSNSVQSSPDLTQLQGQMAGMSVEGNSPDGHEKRRNVGNGILGSYPHGNRFGPPINDESQLSTAARAIVNSIRCMQAKTTHYNHDNRRPDAHNHQNYHSKHENYHSYQNGRNRYKPDQSGNTTDQSEKVNQPMGDRRVERNHRPMQVNPVSYRAPFNVVRQMSPATWYRRSPGPLPPHLNNPRRPAPDTRNHRRQ